MEKTIVIDFDDTITKSNLLKFYKSTAGCGRGEYAIVMLITDRDYLCIFSNEQSDIPIHIEGEIVKNLEDIYLEKVADIDINNYPISKTFLFKFFIDNFYKGLRK